MLVANYVLTLLVPPSTIQYGDLQNRQQCTALDVSTRRKTAIHTHTERERGGGGGYFNMVHGKALSDSMTKFAASLAKFRHRFSKLYL